MTGDKRATTIWEAMEALDLENLKRAKEEEKLADELILWSVAHEVQLAYLTVVHREEWAKEKKNEQRASAGAPNIPNPTRSS